jgi:undecaprenyl-diphosphatase
VAWALAAAVCIARVYVGAHLPLDVIGGAALGWAAGGLTHLILGAPDGRPSLKRVRKALAEEGLDADDLEPVGTDFRNSSTYVTGGTGDDGLFVKAVPREWRDTDLLYRAWRVVARRRRPRLRFAVPLHKVEHEASMALLAAAAGVRVPKVLLVREFGYGAGLLVERRIHGRGLADLDQDEVGDALLGETWRQVSLLHQTGMAHGDLVPANLMVDHRGQPWLVDFDQAVHAGGELQALDVRSLLNGLTGLVGPDRARAAAEAALGRDALEMPEPKSRPVPA